MALGAAPPQQAAAHPYLSQSQAAPLLQNMLQQEGWEHFETPQQAAARQGSWPTLQQDVHEPRLAAELRVAAQPPLLQNMLHQEGWEHFETSQRAAARQLAQQAEAAQELAAQQRAAAQPQAAAQQAVAQSYLSQLQAAPLPLPPGPWPAVHQAVQQVEPAQQQAPPQPSGAVPATASTLHPAHDTKAFPPEDWRLVLDSNDDPWYYEKISNTNWTVSFNPEDDEEVTPEE